MVLKDVKKEGRTLTIDLEANGLLDTITKIHCIVAKDYHSKAIFTFGDNKFCKYPLAKFKKLLAESSKVILHNGIGYDLPVIARFLQEEFEIGYVEYQGQEIPCDKIGGRDTFIFDTLIYSKLLNPDRLGGHSLESWGKRTGEWKGEFKPQNFKDPEGKPYTWESIPVSKEMVDYCIQDVISTEKAYDMMQEEAFGWDWEESFNLEKAVAHIIQRQEEHGIYFDQELARKNVKELNEMLADIEERVEKLLPPRPLNVGETKYYTPPVNQVKTTKVESPKIQFKKDGKPSANLERFAENNNCTIKVPERLLVDKSTGVEYILPLSTEKPWKETIEPSSYMINFVEKLGGKWTGDIEFELDGQTHTLPIPDEPIVKSTPMRLADQESIKAYLITLGWQPLVYKEKDLTVDSKKQKLDIEKFKQAVERYVDGTIGTPFEKDRREAIKGGDKPDLKDVLLDHYRKSSAKKYAEHWQKKGNRSTKQYPLRVATMPSYTIDADKNLCPSLIELGKKVEFVGDIVKWLTYRHRRNSILSPKGGGFLAHPRLLEDSRLPTPADTLGCNCLTADSLIVTDKGVVPIVEVHKGDLVLTHKGRYKPVVDRIVNGVKETLEVTSSNGLSLTCTEAHPFWTEKGWVEAKDLEVGQEVFFYQKEERWKRHPEGEYFVSSWGRVADLFMQPLTINKRVKLWSRANVDVVLKGKRVKKGIGQLVLGAFKGECPKGKEVCHKDGNPMNNCLENLYYGTSKENSEDAKKHGKHLKAVRENSKIPEDTVKSILDFYESVEYRRGMDGTVAKKYGIDRRHVNSIRRGVYRNRDANTENLYREVYSLCKIEAIVPKGEAPTYDITIEEDHSYVANGFVTHNTGRFQHRIVANIPRVTSLYGEPMRAMFGVPLDKWQIGCDADALEARIEGHFVIDFEGGREHAEQLVSAKPNDIHSVRARKLGISRDDAKTVGYALLYGAQPAKLAKQMGVSLEEAQRIYNEFWDAAPALKEYKEYLLKEWEERGKLFIVGPDGRKLMTRSAHSILNVIFQHSGVLAMKRAMVFWDKWVKEENLKARQIIAYHDEAQVEEDASMVRIKYFDDKEEAEKFKAAQEEKLGEHLSNVGKRDGKFFVARSRAGHLQVMSILKGGEFYNYNVALTSGWDLGKNWAECH